MLELWRILNQLKQKTLTIIEIKLEALKKPLEGEQNILDIPKGSHKDLDYFHDV